MKPREINALLKSYFGLVRVEEIGPLPIRTAFYREMKDRQYGEEETADAYLWFCDGWLARDDTRKPQKKTPAKR